MNVGIGFLETIIAIVTGALIVLGTKIVFHRIEVKDKKNRKRIG